MIYDILIRELSTYVDHYLIRLVHTTVAGNPQQRNCQLLRARDMRDMRICNNVHYIFSQIS